MEKPLEDYLVRQLAKLDGVPVISEKVCRLEGQVDDLQRRMDELRDFRVRVVSISGFVAMLVTLIVGALDTTVQMLFRSGGRQ